MVIDTLMQANNLDAIVALTNGPAWPTNSNPNEGDLDGHFEYFVGSSGAAAVSGYADITVPAGYIFDAHHLGNRGWHQGRAQHAGLPIGVTFIGRRWSEPELIALAYDYEQATQVRVPPRFVPTIGDDLFPGVPNPALLKTQATQSQSGLAARFR
jgi:amidase